MNTVRIKMGRRQNGFSLIEMLVALAILAILISVCYPAYQQYVLRSYRSEATTQLQLLANAQEHYLADYGQYSNDLVALGLTELQRSERYRYSMQLSEENQAFSATARPVGLQQADSGCAVFTLNHLGQRNVQSPQYLPCWQ